MPTNIVTLLHGLYIFNPLLYILKYKNIDKYIYIATMLLNSKIIV